MSSAHSQAVQVCELVTVHKAEEDWTRRRKKKAKQVAELYPHAFTGKEKKIFTEHKPTFSVFHHLYVFSTNTDNNQALRVDTDGITDTFSYLSVIYLVYLVLL